MFTLAIRQPWAWLIVEGYKDIENRTWPTDYRGTLLIHASKKPDPDIKGLIADVRKAGYPIPDAERMQYGGIVGICHLHDVVTRHHSGWFTGPYGFVLRGRRRLPFHAQRGHLKLFQTEWRPEWD